MRLLACFLVVVTAAPALAQEARTQVPLFSGVGSHSRKVQAKDAKAQRYFDQGLMFMFAFNHDEAVRAFREAARLDPDCPMAYWGIALASGINYNNPSFTEEQIKITGEALKQARAKASGETAANQALIAALAARYPNPSPKDRAGVEQAYSAAMKEVWTKFPGDADIGALYAESLMNLRPWDLWKEDGAPHPGTTEILQTLEAVIKLDADHPLAHHLYIHAVEASPEPGKADASAAALRGKHPALGHLLHMPSHIDIRRGRWHEAVESNRLAVDADNKYQAAVPEQGFYRMYMAHNHHMLTFAAMMQGQSELALATIRKAVDSVPKDWAAVKENAAVIDGFTAMPIEVLKRFGRWEEILKQPEPPAHFPIARTLWHHNRAVAFAAIGKVEKAREAQQAFRAAAKAVPEDAKFSNNTAADLLAVAELVLEGEILFREGKLDAAITSLQDAAAREDKLRYAEPPDWLVQVRHSLGAVMLRAKQLDEAEKVYREDLRRWPDNGWSLHGLAQALQMQGKMAEAARVRERFRDIWQRADVQIRSSCLCVDE